MSFEQIVLKRRNKIKTNDVEDNMKQINFNEDITCGTILLDSNVCVKINNNVKITAIHDVNQYYKDNSIFLDNCGNELGRSLFFANGKENIEIVGECQNLIDGQGGLWKGETDIHHRPSLIRFVNCKNILLKNLNLINSACWCIHLQNCENVIIENLNIESMCNHNNDGIDIDCCRNVIVQNCVLNTGDDSVVIKSTRNVLTNNISIDNCKITSLGAGFKIGTETIGDISDIVFSNSDIFESNGGSIKIITTDGSNIDGITVNNINIHHGTGPLFIANGNRMREYYSGETQKIPGSIKNIKISGVIGDVYARKDKVVCEGKGVLLITGTPEMFIQNIEITNCDFKMPGGVLETQKYHVKELTTEYPEYYTLGTVPAWGAYIRQASNVKLNNVKFSLKENDVRDKVFLADVKNMAINN